MMDGRVLIIAVIHLQNILLQSGERKEKDF